MANYNWWTALGLVYSARKISIKGLETLMNASNVSKWPALEDELLPWRESRDVMGKQGERFHHSSSTLPLVMCKKFHSQKLLPFCISRSVLWTIKAYATMDLTAKMLRNWEGYFCNMLTWLLLLESLLG